MAEKKRKELIDNIMSVKDTEEGNEEEYKAFLETLSIEELENHYDDTILEDLL
jgi:hypothetical protein